ncbi:MAG: ABC transporter permease [Phycisphaerae bacterium]|nr:ABC transporter permease [Phycisphaerae bacterium]
MFYIRLIITSLRSLDSHFLRSLLATLGVLIGVSSVVACMSILEGAQKEIFTSFKSLGSNVLYVIPETARVEGRPVGTAQTLVLDDIDTLMRELPNDIETIAPEAMGSTSIKRFQKSGDFALIATSQAYFEVHDYKARHGRVFTTGESESPDTRVALLGYEVAQKLFGGADPVGQPVKLGGITYRVVGVMEKKGSLGFINADKTVYVPIKTGLKRFFNRKWLNRLTIAAKDPGQLEELEKQVKRVLRRAHKIPVGQDDDFGIFNQEEALQQVNQVMLVFKVVFYSIAGISLVVGGIGIMNIMLVSVTERTREIGVRMAVGARRGDILLQFLVEALVISLVGGGLGLLLGTMFADVMENVLRQLNFKTEINATVVVASLTTAIVVGVCSGIYPAFKASRLDPVDALRYE